MTDGGGVTLVWTAKRPADSGLWRRLPAWKVKELLCRKNPESRMQSLSAWSLLEAVLGPELKRVERTAMGMPYLPAGPRFSLSHCPGLAVLALSNWEVGVDAEPLQALADPASVEAWTARESCGKCLGTGPTKAPDSASLWTGTLSGLFVVSVCTLQGKAEPVRIIEWNGGLI